MRRTARVTAPTPPWRSRNARIAAGPATEESTGGAAVTFHAEAHVWLLFVVVDAEQLVTVAGEEAIHQITRGSALRG